MIKWIQQIKDEILETLGRAVSLVLVDLMSCLDRARSRLMSYLDKRRSKKLEQKKLTEDKMFENLPWLM